MTDHAAQSQAGSVDDALQHPLYAEGVGHMQAGKWARAILCFSSLAHQFPDDERVAEVLSQAQFKAELDASTKVRPKRWVIHWRPIIFGLLVVVLLGILVYGGIVFTRQVVRPALAQLREQRQLEQVLTEAQTALHKQAYDEAEAAFLRLLEIAPADAMASLQTEEGVIRRSYRDIATDGLEQIAVERELEKKYLEAVAIEESGDLDAALAAYMALQLTAPNYRDVRVRVTNIRRTLTAFEMLEEADTLFENGNLPEAMTAYESLRVYNASYETEHVRDRLFQIYLTLGLEELNAPRPTREDVQRAAELFAKAVAFRPTDPDATREHRLAQSYLEGASYYDQGAWDMAVARLEAIYQERPDYLGGRVLELLYTAYIQSGDQRKLADDLYLANERYRAACALPVEDKALCTARIEEILPFLTPTPTPTVTPTPTNTPLPTAVPTPRPLAAYRNQIVFYSRNPDATGLWIMDASGRNRRFLGSGRWLVSQYEAMREQERYSPDEEYYLFVREAGSPQIFYTRPDDPRLGPLPPKQLTDLSGTCYDPVWSPDGGLIAFTSNQDDSDDIWIVRPDGSGRRNLTENRYPWDKHASFSPGGSRIVFWSNRSGVMQIWVMDADGRNARNISNTDWEEYDPIWIK
ncbi:MAG: PD40 domain-containing protein [Anaerolineae bacterium]|nr:PD40 domain-containing protein [Anaerolineae bacterium]